MSKIVTLRLSEEEYAQITKAAESEHRPISNFITHVVLEEITNSLYVDSIEMGQINNTPDLVTRIKTGHKQAASRKGKFVE